MKRSAPMSSAEVTMPARRTRPSRAVGAVVSPALLPAVLALPVFVLWLAADAGFAPVVWYPGALFLLGALAVALLALPAARTAVRGPTAWAIGLLAAYAAWSYLSIAWADVRGDAWDGANRTLLYVTVFALFAALPWRRPAAETALGAFALGTVAVALGTLASALDSDTPVRFFIDGRFSEPAGYPNANAALFLAAVWPSLHLASRHAAAPLVRGLFLAAAGFLVGMAILAQSRGAIFAVPIVAVLFLALVPGRARPLLALTAVGTVTALALGPLLDVYRAADAPATLHDSLERAALGLGWTSLALAAIGVAWGVLDRRVALSARDSRRLDRAAVAAVALAAAVALLVGVARVGDPFAWLGDRWDEFTATGTPAFETGRLSVDLGSNRYDFWRVALRQLGDAPLHGVGADNFALDYVRERRSDEEPLYPHSLVVRALSQTGVVGVLLLAGFLACALAAARRARGRLDPRDAAVAAVAVVTFGYWAVHGSVDWFWEFPGLSAPAFAWLGIAVALGRPEHPPLPRVRPPRAWLRPAGAVLGALAGVAAAFSLALPWLASRQVELAAREWRDDPAAAFARLDSAASLNRLDDRPFLIAGAIAGRLGDREAMREAFAHALERNPGNWYSHVELALVDAQEGRRAEALARLARARELNPGEPVIGLVEGRIRRGEPVSVRAVDRLFLQRVDERTS
jgi:tetratricopeptide (TPR) repeat protein